MVQFLQMLLKEGKLSEEQALAYVDAIKRDIEVVEAKEEMVKEEVERTKAEEQAKEERYGVVFLQNLFLWCVFCGFSTESFFVTEQGGMCHQNSLL